MFYRKRIQIWYVAQCFEFIKGKVFALGAREQSVCMQRLMYHRTVYIVSTNINILTLYQYTYNVSIFLHCINIQYTCTQFRRVWMTHNYKERVSYYIGVRIRMGEGRGRNHSIFPTKSLINITIIWIHIYTYTL